MFVPLHRFLLYLSISIVPKMSRGRGFTIAEIDSLLEIIEEVLPIGPNDWDRVTERHITFYPGLGRTRESLRRKFASLYNHKKPTGDPTCPVYVRNAKRIFERIKEAMDMSDGEGGIGEDVEEEEEEDDADPAVAVPHIHPIGEIIQPNEGGVAAAAANNGGSSVSGSGQVRGSSSVAGTPLVGTRIRTPRQPQGVGIAGNLSDVMQFMLMRAEVENQAEQRRRQEREDLEDRRRREREVAEERYRRQREEAEDRRERRMEMQLNSQSEMMQMFMLSMMEGRIKRKRDDNDKDYSSGRNVGKTSEEDEEKEGDEDEN
jgi:hypothetical protein